MKISKRSSIVIALGGIAATAALAAPGGSAQVPGATTLSYYEPDAQSTFRFVDNPPKGIGNRPGPKTRFSIGDTVTLISPLYDKKGGSRQGTLYAGGTIVKPGGFRKAAIVATGTYRLNDGSQISVQGYFSFGDKVSTASVIGGTGRYEGARGHLSSRSTDNDSTDTLTLLP